MEECCLCGKEFDITEDGDCDIHETEFYCQDCVDKHYDMFCIHCHIFTYDTDYDSTPMCIDCQ